MYRNSKTDDNGVLSEFESLTGVKITDSYENPESVTSIIKDNKIVFSRIRNFLCEATSAKVLAYDSDGNPFITVNNYGKGKVYFVNAPIESSLLSKHNAFDNNPHKVYDVVFKDYLEASPVKLSGDGLVYTYHQGENFAYIVILNHSDEVKDYSLEIPEDCHIANICYGDETTINPFDAAIIKIVKL